MKTFLDQRLPAPLHWTAVVHHKNSLHRILFGYRSQERLRQRLDGSQEIRRVASAEMKSLLKQLRNYARGRLDVFQDMTLDWEGWSPFQHAILQHCYRVPYGTTISYGELAARAGHPRAARAAGSVMAKNRIPIIIPCHRIVPAGVGHWGQFSSPGGSETKRALLELEKASLPHDD